MKAKKFAKEAAQLAAPYRITQGEKFRLKDHDPEDTGGLKEKHELMACCSTVSRC
jgi:hypothetical protein